MNPIATRRVDRMRHVDESLVGARGQQIAVGIALSNLAAAMTAEVRANRVLLPTMRTMKRKFPTWHGDKITLISRQNLYVAHDKGVVENN